MNDVFVLLQQLPASGQINTAGMTDEDTDWLGSIKKYQGALEHKNMHRLIVGFQVIFRQWQTKDIIHS